MNTPDTLFNRHFLLYWLGIAASALGDALVFIALPFVVLALSDSPTALATAVMLGSLPRLAAPFLGALADRLHLKLPLIMVSLLRALVLGALALLAGEGALGLGMLYAASLLNGLLTVFTFSAGAVVIPQLVPQAELARANSLMVGATMGLPLFGYGLAGALVATIGTAGTLLLAVPLFAALALALPWVILPEAAPKGASVLSDMLEGAGFVLKRGKLVLLLLMSLALNAALSTMNVLMPLAMHDLGRGAAGYGLFGALLSAGALGGILSVTLLGSRLQPAYAIGLGNALLALGFAVFSLGGFELLLGGALVAGLGLGILEVAGITLLQLVAPHGLRGKIIGLVLCVNALGLSGGAWLAGQAAALMPASSYFVMAAGLVFGLSVLWAAVSLQPQLVRPVSSRQS
jgi:MFS family permease